VQRLEPDPATPQLADDRDQILQAAAEPPELEDNDGVPGPQIVQAVGQLRAIGVLAAQLILEDPPTTRHGQGINLAVELLVASRDQGVPDQRSTTTDRVDRITVELQPGQFEGGRYAPDCMRKGHWQVLRHSAFRIAIPPLSLVGARRLVSPVKSNSAAPNWPRAPASAPRFGGERRPPSF
jgi:hypothetical protein